MAWRNQENHREETKAVKKALTDAGIDAKVTHGKGTAWGWLHINIGDPRRRNGFKSAPFEHQYTEEELEFHRKVLNIAQKITGRYGEYDGEIVITAQ
jgi:hypothetical protein